MLTQNHQPHLSAPEREQQQGIEPQSIPNCLDRYTDTQSAGKTIGSRSTSGAVRRGRDLEKQIAIDRGALRFQPLLNPGWGRQGIAYGPYKRTSGLAFAVLLCNGHNTSQAERIEPLKRRLRRWWLGSETEPPVERLKKWLTSPQKKGVFRRLWWWMRSAPEFSNYFSVPKLDDNLAIGWFPSEAPLEPTVEGNGLIVRATGFNNGEVNARVGRHLMSLFQGLQNLQTYYVVVLRQQGAAYYMASVSNAKGCANYPNMRPVALDPFNADSEVYAAIYQSVLGQIGFRVDTRVYGSQVAQIPDLEAWYGSAHLADRLCREGLLGNSLAEVGGNWLPGKGQFELTLKGAKALVPDSFALLDPHQPSGLVHALVETSTTITSLGLVWRVQDANNYWRLLAGREQCQLGIYVNGRWEVLAASGLWHLKPKTIHSLQIIDDGTAFSLYLDGQLIFNKSFSDPRLAARTGVGIMAIEANPAQYIRALEAHPRTIAIPPALNLGQPWQVTGSQVAIADDFSGAAENLVGRVTPIGNKTWQRTIGTGKMALTGNSAVRVQASKQMPNPGRTAFTLPWDNPNLADLQVDIQPPGTRRYQREKGRGGLIFWQDDSNYITINNWLDDVYDGASISSFFYLNGYEELFDAVWTNVAERVFWGISHRLRIVFDGMHFMVFIDDEPVLYRALTDVYPGTPRLAINRVGIIANWEWGNDTGSIFRNFVAKV